MVYSKIMWSNFPIRKLFLFFFAKVVSSKSQRKHWLASEPSFNLIPSLSHRISSFCDPFTVVRWMQSSQKRSSPGYISIFFICNEAKVCPHYVAKIADLSPHSKRERVNKHENICDFSACVLLHLNDNE